MRTDGILLSCLFLGSWQSPRWALRGPRTAANTGILQPGKQIKVLYQGVSREVLLALGYAQTKSPLEGGYSRGALRGDYAKIDIERDYVQCSQRGSPSVLSQDQDGRQLVVPSRHFLKLPDK